MDDSYLVIADQFAKLVELSAGHKQKAIEAGFSESIAEQMGLQVHIAMVDTLTRKVNT